MVIVSGVFEIKKSTKASAAESNTSHMSTGFFGGSGGGGTIPVPARPIPLGPFAPAARFGSPRASRSFGEEPPLS